MDNIKILNKCFLFLTVLLCLVLCSCKATPNEDYVVSRADESIYQNEESTVVPVKEVEIDSRWNWKEFTYQDTFQGADGKAQINVDISGVYLDDPVPVLRVSHHSLTAEDLKEKAKVLMPAEEYYNPAKLIEPEILQSWIDDASHRITKAKYNTKLTEDKREKVIKDAELDLAYYTELKQKTDYNPENAISEWQLHDASEHFFDVRREDPDTTAGPKELRIRTAIDENGNFGFMQIFDVSGKSFQSNELEYYKANEYSSRGFCFGSRDTTKDPNNKMTEEEILEKVNHKLKEAGFYMHPSAVLGGDYDMTIWYYPTYVGIDYLCSQVWSNYEVEHQPERLYVQIKGDEIYHLKQICATDAVVENDKLPLISKDEALSLFKKYMQTVYTGAHAASADGDYIPEEMLEEAKAVRIDVSRMEFGYVRIPIKDEPTEFRLVPSWVFYGQSTLEYENGEELSLYTLDANPGIAKGQILMVVNAIDGSYIEAERESYD